MTPINTNTKFAVIAESRIGGRQENQDTCAWQDTKHGFLLLVCDGMGGGPSGKVASQMAADAIVNAVLDSDAAADRRDVLARAIRRANDTLLAAQASEPRLRGMGTTVTALLIDRSSAVVAHVGDSRVYQLRGSSKIFRTFDHSHVFELVKAKALTEEEARMSGESNVITRALGPMEKAEPEIVELPYEKGDRFMLCTDGIWGAMPEKELIRIAGGTKALAGAVESLVIKVDETGRANGGHHDNLTVAILQTPFNSKLKPKMSTRVKYLLYALAALCCISLLGNFIQYRINAGIDNAEARELSDIPTDAVVTRAELVSIITGERERYDSEIENYRQEIKRQDEEYARRLDELQKQLENKSHTVGTEDIKSLSDDVDNMAIVREIDELIAQVSDMKKIKSVKDKDVLSRKSIDAAERLSMLASNVQKRNIHDKDFEKCIKENWITNTVATDVNHKNHKSHLDCIIRALESLKKQVKSSNRAS